MQIMAVTIMSSTGILTEIAQVGNFLIDVSLFFHIFSFTSKQFRLLTGYGTPSSVLPHFIHFS